MYEKIKAPTSGEKISFVKGEPQVPDNPIIPFIRGDGTGIDIWPATQKVLDAAVEKAYGGKKKINWFKVYAGDEACDLYGTYQYLPQDTLTAIKEYGVAIKGPLTTPVGGGIRSLNVALRQIFSTLRLRASLSLLPRYSFPSQKSGKARCDSLSRKY